MNLPMRTALPHEANAIRDVVRAAYAKSQGWTSLPSPAKQPRIMASMTCTIIRPWTA